MRRKSSKKGSQDAAKGPEGVEGETLEPLRVVERELVRPDGTTMTVQVPVYPPFRLKEKDAEKDSQKE